MQSMNSSIQKVLCEFIAKGANTLVPNTVLRSMHFTSTWLLIKNCIAFIHIPTNLINFIYMYLKDNHNEEIQLLLNQKLVHNYELFATSCKVQYAVQYNK
jgi:hypothetical protein